VHLRSPSVLLAAALLAPLPQPLGLLSLPVARAQDAVGLPAAPFTPTTSLRGDARWWLGGVHYRGNQIDAAGNSYDGQPLRDGVVLNQELRLTITTSFDGDDQLRLRLRSGNGGFSPFRDTIAPSLRVSGLSPGRCDGERFCRNNLVVLDKLYYQRPIGDHWLITAGSRVTQKDMIGLWPSLFDDNELMLSLFGKAGAPGAYSDLKGAGLGVVWKRGAVPGQPPGLVLSAVSVAEAADQGDPSRGGLASGAGLAASTLQAGWIGSGWAVALAYTRNQAGATDSASLTPLVRQSWPEPEAGLGGAVDSWGLSGFWQPASGGWWPAFSAGWGFNRNRYARSGPHRASPQLALESQSWMVGLNWFDVVGTDSEWGIAIGFPVLATAYRNPAGERGTADGSLMLETWLQWPASDWLTISPGLFWLPRPRGQLTAAGSSWTTTPLPLGHGATFSAFGALLKLRLRF